MSKPNIIWKPFENTSQELAVDTRAHHTLYHGTRGPGKTCCQLFVYKKLVGMGYGGFWRGIVFDREYKNLSDVIAQSERFFPQFRDGAKFLRSPSDLKWVWPTGEELLFRHVKKLSDYDDYHGHEYPFIAWNELTKQPTSELYDKMMSLNRSSFDPVEDTPIKHVFGKEVYNTPDEQPLPEIPLKVFSTTNSFGPGRFWVKRRFIDAQSYPGELVKTTIRLFNPKSQKEEDITKTQVAIFGSYKENRRLPPEYIFELENEKNPNLRKSWLFGSWDIAGGDAFSNFWDERIHVISRFPIPKEWYIDRSFDWGSSHPFSVGFWAESNGEEIRIGDETKCYPKGTLFRIDEIYGCEEVGKNKGLQLSAKEIAVATREKEIELLKKSWIKTQPKPGPADNQINDVREIDTDTIAKKMIDEGIRWEKSDKSPGSRINGIQLFRERLEASVTGEGPGIYFFRNCSCACEIIPQLPLDEKNIEDIDTNSEDHIWDEVRYRVLKSNNRTTKNLNVKFPI